MKTVGPLRFLFLSCLAFVLASSPLLRAQENAPAPEAPPAVTPPAAPASPAEPAPSAEPAENSADEAGEEEKPLRDLTASSEEPTTVEATPAPERADKETTKVRRRSQRSSGAERVSVFSDSTLGVGQRAQVVVSIFGSSESAGEVGEAVVSVIGGSKVSGGTVGDSVVSVLGNTYVNGHVKGEVVTVLGNAELGPDAVVDGDVVTVGGKLKRAETAVIHGEVNSVAVGGDFFNFGALTTWIHECLVKGRPLAFHSDLTWAWAIAFVFLAISVLIALIAPAGVVKCAETLEQKPGSCLLAAILALLLTPVAYILLTFTLTLVVGFVLIPVFSFGLFLAGLVGKAAMLAWLGRRLMGKESNVVLAVLLGGLIVLALYTVWGVGFVTYGLVRFVGMGVVIYTLILTFKNSRPAKPVTPRPGVPMTSAAAVVPPTPVIVTPAPIVPMAPEMTPPAAEAGYQAQAQAMTPPIAPPIPLAAPVVISAATLPRAGFWVRLGASLLDFILIGIVLGMLTSVFRGWFSPGGSLLFWFAVYCVAMWATKGTTIGGIICGLKVVRLDDRPLDWGVCIVRALGGFLSFAVAGLGFIWVSFDDDRQSWHDKIAGTTIVKVPKGTSLM